MKKLISLTLLMLVTQTVYSANENLPLLWPTGCEVTGGAILSLNLTSNEYRQTLTKTPQEITVRMFFGKNTTWELNPKSQLQQQKNSMCSIKVKREGKVISAVNYWIDVNRFFCINPWNTQFFSRVKLKAEESLPSAPSTHSVIIDKYGYLTITIPINKES